MKVLAAACFLAFFAAPSAIFAQSAPTPAPLVKYQVVNGAIPASLTGHPGDAVRGKAVAVDRKLGNCLSCHVFPLDEPDQGNLGPDLHGVGKLLTVGQIRLRVVNPKLVNPLTIMPAYYRVDGLSDVLASFSGKPILTADQVEDLVAYLSSLK